MNVKIVIVTGLTALALAGCASGPNTGGVGTGSDSTSSTDDQAAGKAKFMQQWEAADQQTRVVMVQNILNKVALTSNWTWTDRWDQRPERR
jgi:hypothetical protein